MADSTNGPGAGPGTQNLDLALRWMERSLDELTEATRRTKELATDIRATPEAGPAAASPKTLAIDAPAATGTSATGTSGTGTPAPPSTSTTPLLDKIGRDLTKLAAAGSLPVILDREEETRWLIEILVRDTKRNPVLLGPAGSGKTAIVEGLAQRIVAGSVPERLRGTRIIEVPLSGLVAGTQYRGQLEERLVQLVQEASQPGIVLFFDEVHLLEGAGRSEGGIGTDEALKPALARGDIAVIGATTAEDYRATIENDPALARRFTTVAITELDRTATRPIVQQVRDGLEKSRGVHVSDAALDVLLAFAEETIINRRFPDKAIDLLEQAVATAIVDGRTRVDRDDALRTTEVWATRASSTPTLDRFGRDLVRLARDGKLGPIVGRDREIDAIIQVLLRRSKRNPLLIGPAGSGKTAIVEGLALRIAAGTVPSALRDIRLFDVPLLSLAAGVVSQPRLVGDLLLEARHPSVVVFFDEIHQLSSPAVHDLGEALKPALARGEIACIGATTGEEYQAYLEPEAALARRFTVIAVEPMDEGAVRTVLRAVADSLGRLRGISVEDPAIDELVALADQYLPNRSFPDKGVDMVEQAVAYAASHDKATVDVATAREAIAAFVGRDLDPATAIVSLAAEIRQRELLDEGGGAALIERLGVSLRGLDSHGERPDAAVLLCGDSAVGADLLAAALARNLYGRETAVIAIDLAGLTEDSSISTLLGSAPGLVGSDRPLPLHALRRTPWQVVLFRGVDRCALSIRETIASALASGSFTDAMGRKIPLGAAIVVMTAPTVTAADTSEASGARPVLTALLGIDLVDACDVIAGGTTAAAGTAGTARAGWLRSEVLEPLAARFSRRGYTLTFDPAFITWLEANLSTNGELPAAFLDRVVTPKLVEGLPAQPGPVTVGIADNQPALSSATQSGRTGDG